MAFWCKLLTSLPQPDDGKKTKYKGVQVCLIGFGQIYFVGKIKGICVCITEKNHMHVVHIGLVIVVQIAINI